MFLSNTAHAAVILVWGDSLSAGYGVQPGQEWPALLQKKLDSNQFPYQVVNLSLSGETSTGGRTRLPEAITQHKPAIVIVALGANDALRGQKLSNLADNIKNMIETARAGNAEILLAGMQIPPNYGHAYTERFSRTFSKLAQSENVALVPFLLEGFAEKSEYFQQDGIHPTAQAQPLILQNIWRILEPMLEQNPELPSP